MLNVKVTNRTSYEDFVANGSETAFILPKQHIFIVGATAILCAAFVIALPSTWLNLTQQDQYLLTESERAYLNDDHQNYQDSTYTNDGSFEENYYDFDIPSQYFANQNNNGSLSQQNASQEELDTVFNPDVTKEEAKKESDLAQKTLEDASKIANTWADPTIKAGQDTNLDMLAGSNPQGNLTQENQPKEQKIPSTRPQGTWYVYTVSSGDSLSSIFSFLDLPYATLNRITRVSSNKDIRLNIGDPIYFLINKDNVVLEMVKPLDRKQIQQVRFTRLSAEDDFALVYEGYNTHVSKELLANIKDASTMPLAINAQKVRKEKAEQLAKAQEEQRARDKANNVNPNRPRLVIDKIQHGENFATAARRAGLTPSEIKTIESIFKNKVNLNKLKPGDKFRALFSGIGTQAELSAIKIDSSRGSYESFMNPEDRNYYGENEFTPTAGIFRRFPMAGDIKVNSNFNPHRRHPVTGRISPHNGIDFKATIGTPVYAPADGTVSFSGYQRAAGYYVIIRHANNYSTVYMHLSKSEVKVGQKVIVGQLIARTGNTGRTTGPHLHYEVRINDRPVDPLKIELPSSNHPNLAREQREAFANNVKLLRADLQNDRLALSK